MKQTKNSAFFALAILIASCSFSTIEAHGVHPPCLAVPSADAKDMVWGLVGVIGAATGIYALGRWAGWWGAPSNETLLERGRNSLAQADQYQRLLRIIMHVHEGEMFDIVHHLDEHLLYDCAVAKRSLSSIDAYVSTLHINISDLKEQHSSLHDRMSDLYSNDNDWQRVKYIHDRMQHLDKQIQDTVGELELLHAFLREHVSYFRLFEIEDKLAQKYCRELEILQQHGQDEYTCNRSLRSTILSRYSGAFALVEFVKYIRHDCNQLQQTLGRSAYNYATRIGYVQALLNNLHTLQEIVVADPEYMRLLAEYEHAQREKERLRLERERVHAEQRIAAAKEREAYAKQREAAAKEREVCAKEKENRLKEQEMWQQGMQTGW